jgi:hypothetical protein
MFGTILISICTFMHAYVFWRAASVPFVDQHISKKVLIGAAVILWVLFYLGRVVGHGGTGILAIALEFMGMTWMAVLFLTFVPLSQSTSSPFWLLNAEGIAFVARLGSVGSVESFPG